MQNSASARPFPADLRESDVRRLCGDAAFRRGDVLERAGGVLNPTLGQDTIGSEVRGTWRRLDRVSVQAGFVSTAREQFFHGTCTCKAPGLCRHAAALLLHWVRQPSSFTQERSKSSSGGPAAGGEQAGRRQEETPPEEMARLLGQYTVPELRALARKRGVRLPQRAKSELVELLVPALAEPGGLDAALQALDEGQRAALDATDLAAASGPARPEDIARTYRALGGEEEPDLDAVHALGLILRANAGTYAPPTYVVPRLVAARLPARGDLVALVEAAPNEPGRASVLRAGMLEVFQVIAHQLTQGHITVRVPSVAKDETESVPPGWRLDPTDGSRLQTGQKLSYAPRTVRLAPLPPVITARDLGQLVEQTGLPAGTVEFALRLLLALKIAVRQTVRVGPTQDKERHLVVYPDRLQALFARPPAERLRRVIDTWLAMDDAAELGPVVSRHGGLELHFNRPYYVGWGTKGPEGAAARRLVARLIGRLAAGDTPYDLTSLLDLLWHLAPDRLGTATDHMGQATWWFTPEGQSSHRLDLEKRQDWERVWRPLVESILAGPLTWLGLVEAERGEEAFRVRPAAAALSGRPVAGAPLEGTEPLVVEVAPGETALMVVVPPNTLNPEVHARLLELGEMAEASPLGLRYRLPAERIQFAFEDGMTGPELLDLLADLAGGDLPAPARRLVERWWAGYGSVRLYDDLTLVELGDDLLLRELTATTSLRQGVIHTFSPRLVAVEPALADTLVRELLRLGHTPSVVEAP